MIRVIKLVNQTTGAIALDKIHAINMEVAAGIGVATDIGSYNTLEDVRQDSQLDSLVNSDLILIETDEGLLTKSESLQLLAELDEYHLDDKFKFTTVDGKLGGTIIGDTIIDGTITANSIIKDSGLSTEFLKADGSVDNNIYLTTSSASSTYQPLGDYSLDTHNHDGRYALINGDISVDFNVNKLILASSFQQSITNTEYNRIARNHSTNSALYVEQYGTGTIATFRKDGGDRAWISNNGSFYTNASAYVNGTDKVATELWVDGTFLKGETKTLYTTDDININQLASNVSSARTQGVINGPHGTAHGTLLQVHSTYGFQLWGGGDDVFYMRYYASTHDSTWNRIASREYVSSTYGTITNLNLKANIASPTFTGIVTSPSFVKSGGTSSQFLKADGSVDSNTYLTTGTAVSTYLPITGGTITGSLIIDQDLTVLGTTTTIDSINTTIKDPILTLGNGNITDAVDIGFIGIRNSNNIGFIWDESSDEFATVYTLADGSVSGNTSIVGYADIHANLFKGDGSLLTGLTKSQVGLGNVDNTSDLLKPISTAVQTALDLKANIASPTFTGIVTSPSFVKSGGTSSQFLKADGSVDSNTYTTNSLASGRILVGSSLGIATPVAMSGDVTISNTGVTAIGSAMITSAMLRNSTALSVIGRSANSTGVPADITASTNGHVLRRSASVLGFGTIDDTSITSLDFSKLINKPTTIAGYGITDAYTKTETDLLLSTYPPGDILIKLLTVDGSGSLLDADLLDGEEGTFYLNWNNFTNTPTTVSGYGITDVYTKTEIEASLDLKYDKTGGDISGAVNVLDTVTATGFIGDGSLLTGLTKAQVGLSNVNNTSDASKPISTATQSGLDLKVNRAGDTITGYLDVQNTVNVVKLQIANNISAITSGIRGNGQKSIDVNTAISNTDSGSFWVGASVSNSPSDYTIITQFAGDVTTGNRAIQLAGSFTSTSDQFYIRSKYDATNTWKSWNRIATREYTDSTYGTITNLNLKANIASPTFTGTVSGITKAMVGLGNVDNTSDVNKPISTATQIALNLKEDKSNKGIANGYAELDGTGKVPSNQLPSFVDDVLEYTNISTFPVTGESGKIYIALDTNLTYRWGGTVYVSIGNSLSLGETSSTAYRGDRGKIAYDHTLNTSNPHSVTKAQVGLGNVDNTADLLKPISTATQTALNLKANIASPTFTGIVTSPSFVKSGGTSSQFLKADGSVDSNAYLTTSSASGLYLPLTGGTLSGVLTVNANEYVSGDLSSVTNSNARLLGFIVPIDGYASSSRNTISFRHDKNEFAFSRLKGYTITETGSKVFGNLVDNFFNEKGTYNNLYDSSNPGNDYSIEIIPTSYFGNSANTSWRYIISSHNGLGTNIGNILVEIKNGSLVWETVFNSQLTSDNRVIMQDVSLSVGNVYGIRFTFTNITANCYINHLGLEGKLSSLESQWYFNRAGGNLYGSIVSNSGATFASEVKTPITNTETDVDAVQQRASVTKLTHGDNVTSLTNETIHIKRGSNQSSYIRLTEDSSYRGWYITYDGINTNKFIMGTHANQNESKSDDIPFMRVDRGSTIVEVIGNITSSAFVKSGGTSTQFLKADGSVDSNTYLTTGSATGIYLPIVGGTELDMSAVTLSSTSRSTFDNGLVVSSSSIIGTNGAIEYFDNAFQFYEDGRWVKLKSNIVNAIDKPELLIALSTELDNKTIIYTGSTVSFVDETVDVYGNNTISTPGFAMSIEGDVVFNALQSKVRILFDNIVTIETPTPLSTADTGDVEFWVNRLRISSSNYTNLTWLNPSGTDPLRYIEIDAKQNASKLIWSNWIRNTWTGSDYIEFENGTGITVTEYTTGTELNIRKIKFDSVDDGTYVKIAGDTMTGPLIVGTATVNGTLSNSISVGVSNTISITKTMASSIIVGDTSSINSDTDRTILIGQGISINAPTKDSIIIGAGHSINSSVYTRYSSIIGVTNSLSGSEVHSSSIIGTSNVLNSGSTVTSSLISGEGHIIDSNKSLISSMIIGAYNKISDTVQYTSMIGHQLVSSFNNQVIIGYNNNNNSNNIFEIGNGVPQNRTNAFSVSYTGIATAYSFTKVGGISTEFLKADGSVDSNTYLTTGTATTTYLPITGGTITGSLIIDQDLTVLGTTTTINSTNVVVSDVVFTMGSGNITDALDIGFIGIRASDNIGMVWDESSDVFSFVYTDDDGTTSGNINILGYTDLRAKDITSAYFYGNGSNITGLTKSQVGLSNVDNTTDLLKPISTATQTALNLKANIASPTFTGTVSGISKSMVGLGNVDNTTDLLKPISTATQTALNLKANIASPTFTGTVTSPTFVKSGGTSSQFLKADGSVDSNTYTQQSVSLTDNYIPYSVSNQLTNTPMRFEHGNDGSWYYNRFIIDSPEVDTKTISLSRFEYLNAGGFVVALDGGGSNTFQVADSHLLSRNVWFSVNDSGTNTYGSATATSFVKSGGTSSQFLKADGSVDSNTYLTTSGASGTYLPLAGGTLTGALLSTSYAVLGNAHIGNWYSGTSSARVGHKDFNLSSNYGLVQTNTGVVNIAGPSVNLFGETTVSGSASIRGDSYEILTLKRNHATNGAGIDFLNLSGRQGRLGMSGTGLTIFNALDSATLTLDNSGNLTVSGDQKISGKDYTLAATGTLSGTSSTQTLSFESLSVYLISATMVGSNCENTFSGVVTCTSSNVIAGISTLSSMGYNLGSIDIQTMNNLAAGTYSAGNGAKAQLVFNAVGVTGTTTWKWSAKRLL